LVRGSPEAVDLAHIGVGGALFVVECVVARHLFDDLGDSVVLSVDCHL
jgi:hypothetical protein